MSDRGAEIMAALLKLDVTNKDHWTAEGFPRIEALGLEGVKRADVVRAAPHFTRMHPTFTLEGNDEDDEVDGTGTPDANTTPQSDPAPPGDASPDLAPAGSLDEDDELDVPEGAERVSGGSFQMQSSEFGAGPLVDEDEDDGAPLARDPVPDRAAAEAALERAKVMLAEANEDAAHAERRRKRASDVVDRAIVAAQLPDTHVTNQRTIMNFLASVAKQPKMDPATGKPAVAQIDKAFAAKRERGTNRPVRTNRS